MRATVEVTIGLDVMADDLAATVVANGSQAVDRAFEAVEHVPHARSRDFERLVVVITADFTPGHELLLESDPIERNGWILLPA